MMVAGEGMPSKGNPFVKGNLYVAFHIDFPKTLSKDIADKLRDLLPDADMEEEYDENEVPRNHPFQCLVVRETGNRLSPRAAMIEP